MSKFMAWIDERLPVSNFVKNHLSQYYAPKNFNFFYYFGALAIFIFILQIVTGIFLTINYKPDAASAFASVEYIMRDVEWGWLIRYLHSTGASLSLIHISEPTRRTPISYAVFCLKKVRRVRPAHELAVASGR